MRYGLRNYPLSARQGAGRGPFHHDCSIFGPIIGDVTDNFSWPWLSYIPLAVGAFSAAASWSILSAAPRIEDHNCPVERRGSRASCHRRGQLQFMLDNGNEEDWFNSPLFWRRPSQQAIIAILILHYPWELTTSTRVDLRLFGGRIFRAANLYGWGGLFAFRRPTIIFPLWLQTTVGYPPLGRVRVAPLTCWGCIVAPIVAQYDAHQAAPRRHFAFCGLSVFPSFGTATLMKVPASIQFATPGFSVRDWHGIFLFGR